MIQASITDDGTVWMLVTRFGGSDPDGCGGFVVSALGGSGCRWLRYDPSDVQASPREFAAAQRWHADQGTLVLG